MKHKNIGTVKGLGDIYQVSGPLDQQLLAFADEGIHTLAAPDEVAQIRLAGVSKNYSRTSMAPIVLKSEKTILVRDSILMNLLMAAAVRAHASKKYFETDRKFYETAEAIAKSQESMAPEDRRALIVSKRGDFILTPEMPESRFILRKQTKPYFDKLTNGTMEFYNILGYPDSQVILNCMWFGSPRSYSSLDCRRKGLDSDGRAFGVLRTAESSAKNIGASDYYTPADILRFNNIMKNLEEYLRR